MNKKEAKFEQKLIKNIKNITNIINKQFNKIKLLLKTYKCNLQFILSRLALIYSVVLDESSYLEIAA
jgi:hypothetical protein